MLQCIIHHENTAENFTEIKVFQIISNQFRKYITFTIKFIFTSPANVLVSNNSEDSTLTTKDDLGITKVLSLTMQDTFTEDLVTGQHYWLWNFRPGISWFITICSREKWNKSNYFSDKTYSRCRTREFSSNPHWTGILKMDVQQQKYNAERQAKDSNPETHSLFISTHTTYSKPIVI